MAESNFLTKSFERKISYSKNLEENEEPKEDISLNILETFNRESPEFKENLAKIPSELLALFQRQFQSSPMALRVGKIETKEDARKAKKRLELSDDAMDESLIFDEEEDN